MLVSFLFSYFSHIFSSILVLSILILPAIYPIDCTKPYPWYICWYFFFILIFFSFILPTLGLANIYATRYISYWLCWALSTCISGDFSFLFWYFSHIFCSLLVLQIVMLLDIFPFVYAEPYLWVYLVMFHFYFDIFIIYFARFWSCK